MRERARRMLAVQEVAGFEIVEALSRDDRDRRRWYADGGKICLVLTESGQLLEPFPTFGLSAYRRLAREVSFHEADTYARAHGFVHLRQLPR
jgi:hypothetical protein